MALLIIIKCLLYCEGRNANDLSQFQHLDPDVQMFVSCVIVKTYFIKKTAFLDQKNE